MSGGPRVVETARLLCSRRVVELVLLLLEEGPGWVPLFSATRGRMGYQPAVRAAETASRLGLVEKRVQGTTLVVRLSPLGERLARGLAGALALLVDREHDVGGSPGADPADAAGDAGLPAL